MSIVTLAWHEREMELHRNRVAKEYRHNICLLAKRLGISEERMLEEFARVAAERHEPEHEVE